MCKRQWDRTNFAKYSVIIALSNYDDDDDVNLFSDLLQWPLRNVRNFCFSPVKEIQWLIVTLQNKKQSTFNLIQLITLQSSFTFSRHFQFV